MSAPRLLATVLAGAALAIPLALAGPAPTASAGTLTWAPLPFTPTISGASGQSTVALTLPSGATPVGFAGEVRSTYDDEGSIVITLNGRRVADLPARTGGVISVPLTAADMEDGAVVVGMYADLDPQVDCFVDTTSVASLVDGAVSYSHDVAAPTTIGAFLSDGLQDLTVHVGTQASQAEQQAALDAVAALVHRYRPPAVVRLVVSDEPPAGDFLRRAVVVRAGPSSPASGPAASAIGGGTLAVTEDGYLLVTGPAEALSGTAFALADPALELVAASTLASVAGTPDWSPATGTSTLAALGTGAVSLSGVGRARALIGIGQPAFGRPVSALSLELVGAVTALPPGATGRIDFLWNGVLVESRDMSAGTSVAVGIDLAAEQLRRDNTLAIELSYVPPSGACTPPPLPARLDIDPGLSTVTPTYGDSVPEGFERFPQVLGPAATVVLGPAGEPARLLQQAGDLIAGLAAATPEQLAARLVPLGRFLDDDVAGIIVGASGPLTQQLGAPYAIGTVVEVKDGAAAFSAELKGPVALGQAFDDGERNIVLLGPLPSGPGDPGASVALERTDEFAAQVASGPLRWTALTGRVMAMGASGQLDAVPLPPAPSGVVSVASLLVIGIIVTLIIIAGLILWSFNKPKEPAPTVPGAAITS